MLKVANFPFLWKPSDILWRYKRGNLRKLCREGISCYKITSGRLYEIQEHFFFVRCSIQTNKHYNLPKDMNEAKPLLKKNLTLPLKIISNNIFNRKAKLKDFVQSIFLLWTLEITLLKKVKQKTIKGNVRNL